MASNGLKLKPLNTNFIIRGLGVTKEIAAVDFLHQFHRQFPKIKGLYDMLIRYPLSYDVDLDGNHTYMLRGSATLLKSMDQTSPIISNDCIIHD